MTCLSSASMTCGAVRATGSFPAGMAEASCPPGSPWTGRSAASSAGSSTPTGCCRCAPAPRPARQVPARALPRHHGCHPARPGPPPFHAARRVRRQPGHHAARPGIGAVPAGPGAWAGFFIGDPHYAQGDGEIALTALEAPLTATLTLDLMEAERARATFGAVTGPVALTADFVVPTGLDAELP